MSWSIVRHSRVKLRKPVLIEGLPGIGNVGKIAGDFLIDQTNAKLLFRVRGNKLPSVVYINEESLVEKPSIEGYYARTGKGDIIILTGDVQPIDEESSYDFCDKILTFLSREGGDEIITMAGIGLNKITKKPKVYCTGNNKKTVKKYLSLGNIKGDLYGVVGNIIGVSGLLVGMAGEKRINAVSLLAETFSHPMYLGIGGAKAILRVISKRFGLTLKLSKLDRDLKDVERELIRQLDMAKPGKNIEFYNKERNYIG